MSNDTHDIRTFDLYYHNNNNCIKLKNYKSGKEKKDRVCFLSFELNSI